VVVICKTDDYNSKGHFWSITKNRKCGVLIFFKIPKIRIRISLLFKKKGGSEHGWWIILYIIMLSSTLSKRMVIRDPQLWISYTKKLFCSDDVGTYYNS